MNPPSLQPAAAAFGELDLLHLKFARLPHALTIPWGELGTGRFNGIHPETRRLMFLRGPVRDGGRVVGYEVFPEDFLEYLHVRLAETVAAFGPVVDFLFQDGEKSGGPEVRAFFHKHATNHESHRENPGHVPGL